MRMDMVKIVLVVGLGVGVDLCASAQVPPMLHYQGRVVVNGTNFDGVGQFKFALVDGAGATYWSNDGTPSGEPAIAVTQTVTRGLFSVLLGDTNLAHMTAVSASVFTNSDVRVRVWIDTGGGFQNLTPDQRIASVGYAMRAGGVVTGGITGAMLSPDAVGSLHIADGTISNADLAANAITTDKIADGTIDVADLSTEVVSNTFWRLTGNAGTAPGTHFLGTTDNRALELCVNRMRALRLDTNNNVIGGACDNFVPDTVGGATISGGEANTNLSPSSFIGGGIYNAIGADATNATVGGGYGNVIGGGAKNATLGGGRNNVIGTNAYGVTLSGGGYNTVGANALNATLSGGRYNNIDTNAWYATLGGGNYNTIGCDATNATLVGGYGNVIGANAQNVTLGGGYSNAIGVGAGSATLGGGRCNAIGTNTYGATLGGGLYNAIGASAGYSTLGGGRFNAIGTNAQYSTLGGGSYNTIGSDATNATLGGGYGNAIGAGAWNPTLGGGYSNAIGIGAGNATLGGGRLNAIGTNAYGATLGGGFYNAIGDNAGYSTLGGGRLNAIGTNAWYATLGGGNYNTIGCDATNATLGGGYGNVIGANAQNVTLGGGYSNAIGVGAKNATLGGGRCNAIGTNAYGATLGGGLYNAIGANAGYSIICGGYMCAISDNASYAFAAGRRAKANHMGSFVWGDSTDADVNSSAGNEVTFRSYGGYRIFTGDGMGVQVASGGGTWSSMSDRHVKENFAPVDPREVLKRVAALPVTTWNMKTQNPSIRHMGPMAQDFRAAFSLGEDERYINNSDIDGVTLASIQGLYQQNQDLQVQTRTVQDEHRSQIHTLQEENRLLKDRLAKLEEGMSRLLQQRSIHAE
jgi:trimeric autotransporter adhesin